MLTKLIIHSLSLLLLICSALNAQPIPNAKHVDSTLKPDPENLNVFHQWVKWNDPGSMLIDYMNDQAIQYFDQREKEIQKIKNKEDWIRRQASVKNTLKQLFHFPEKTNLNPVITGTIRKDNYRIEKLIFESRPGFYVTGCLFIPDQLQSKAPAVLNLIGHEQEAFRAELDQLVMINLVRNGMIVMSIDPPGQGENVQYFDPQVNFSSIGYSVIEHCYFGNQCFLSGISSANYFVWDAIRAIDYLVSRPEVDPKNLGVTGFSGGGTITAYLGAIDDRIKVAIPSSWSTASRRQLETKGAQDAEAELYRSLTVGISFEDLLEVRAPKPTMLTFVSRDQYLSLQGARDAYAEAVKTFAAFDKKENLVLIEDDSRHWLTPKIRWEIYAFFMRHFNLPGDPVEKEIEILTEKEMMVTPTGQIATSYQSRMIFDIQQDETRILLHQLKDRRSHLSTHLKQVVDIAKEISGYQDPGEHRQQPLINGRYQRDGYSVSKFALEVTDKYAIPFLLFMPDAAEQKFKTLIYLHPEGKTTEAHPEGEIENLVKKGYIVAAVDPIGIGETKNTATRGLAVGYTGALIAKSVVGIQASDIIQVSKYLQTIPQVDPEQIEALAFDGMCIPLIHAAAFDPSIDRIYLVRPLISYQSVATNRFYQIGLTKNEGGGSRHPYEVDFSWGVPGALTGYDLPDLLACLVPRKVVLSSITNHLLTPASSLEVEEAMTFPRAVFDLKNAAINFKIIPPTADLNEIFDY